MKTRKYSTKTWNEHPLHPKVADCRTVDWLVFLPTAWKKALNISIIRIFLIDLLNFSFWSDLDVSDKSTPHPDRYAVNYGGQSYTGYWSLCAAVNRGW
jgi:hypothetical protein